MVNLKIHFQKLLSILCVIVLFASLAVPAFAEDAIEVEEGYNIDCVPYSPYISSLIVTDNEEEEAVYYSSSKARTYSATASTFSVASTSTTSDTSTDYLYSFSDYLSLFSSKGQWSPYYNSPVFYETVTDTNGKRGLKLLLGGDSTATYHQAYRSLSNLKTGNKYSFTFTFIQQALVAGTMYIRFYDSTDESKYVDVYNYVAPYGSGKFLKVNKTISGNIVIPDDWSGSVNIRFRIEDMQGKDGAQPTIYINDFVIRDITNENLDKSLDKFGDRLENAGSDEPALDTDISAFQSAIDTMNGWLDQLDEFADSIDASGQTANEYISKGTEIFNGFISVAPSAVIALVAFGVVFIVVRKIVGR